MPWSIDNIVIVLLILILPTTTCRCRGDCDSSFLLLLHPVHRGRAIVDFANLVNSTGVEEDSLCGGCLARVNVCDDADIPAKSTGFGHL